MMKRRKEKGFESTIYVHYYYYYERIAITPTVTVRAREHRIDLQYLHFATKKREGASS
jgi:hypothetical protein